MDAPGFSIWILLILVALVFVVLWGALVVLLAFGTWFISRSRLPDEDPRPSPESEWDAPRPPGPRSVDR